jgi:multidrug efflux pump subunit AcrA (membrane-fusion protein)
MPRPWSSGRCERHGLVLSVGCATAVSHRALLSLAMFWGNLTIGNLWQNEAMACAASGLFLLQASPSPLLIGVHATAEVASRARTRRVKSSIGKRILEVFAVGRMVLGGTGLAGKAEVNV